MNLVEMSHIKTAKSFDGVKIDFAIDATLGRGRDALFAASLLREGGEVYAFDLQKSAIDESAKLLSENGLQVSVNSGTFQAGKNYCIKGVESGAFFGRHLSAKFFQMSHADMENQIGTYLSKGAGAVFFNLGWLPNSDKKIVTKSEDTLTALKSVLKISNSAKIALSVLSYRAHDGGEQEYEAVKNFFAKHVEKYEILGDENNKKSPILFFARLNFE